MEKIIINGRMLRDPSHTRILFILGLYWLKLIVGRKLFPSRVTCGLLKSCHGSHGVRPPWDPPIIRFVHIETRPQWDPSTSRPSVLGQHAIRQLVYHRQVFLNKPVDYYFTLFSCPLTPWVRDPWVNGPVGWRFTLCPEKLTLPDRLA